MAVRLSIFVLAAGVAALLFAPALPAPESKSANVSLVADASERSPLYDHTVNGVLGDESFIATFGRRPGPGDSEGLRLRTHLVYVEQLLRERPVDHLSEEQRTARARNLDRLHDYWTAGVFPRNTVMSHRRTPVFIDEAGRICAVGYLFERDLGREAAERINARYRTATIFEIDDPVLGEWLATSGLSLEEAAMIQPGYGPAYTVEYSFDTTGPTECGANENPSPQVTLSWPWPTFDASEMERSPVLTCEDDVDDAFSSSGFLGSFDASRRLLFSLQDPSLVYIFGIDLTVFRSADGPTEGRLMISEDGGTTFMEYAVFPISTVPGTSPPISFFICPAEHIVIAIEAMGGNPTATLHLEHLVVDGVVILPVELMSFNATVNGDTATLQWVTSSETNNAGFELQMRADGESEYHALGFVEGHGTTTEVQTYTFIVPNLDPGAYAFRLKQIDFDGAFEYSDEIQVTVAVPGTHLLTSAYPNPFNPQARFSLSVAQTQNVNVSVYDALGRRVLNLFDGVMAAGSAHPFALDGRGLATGLLFIRATGETFAASQAVTLVR